MSIKKKSTVLSMVAMLLCSSQAWGQSVAPDSSRVARPVLPVDSLCPLPNKVDSLGSDKCPPTAKMSKPQFVGASILRKTAAVSIPMIALTIPYTQSNRYIRDARNSTLPHFHYRYDDYMQFVPLGVQLGMRAFGVEGHSKKNSELLLADALAASIMMTSVTAVKTITRVRRPDGSSYNSFPSGHTAMAFTSATLLHLEYGERYPLLSLGGYLAATSVGVGRILNNRHWVGDVMVGAAVGIASGELGYWLSGLIHKRPCLYHGERIYFNNTDLRVTLPWSRGLGLTHSGRAGGAGMGFRWAYDSKGYYLFADAMLEGQMFEGLAGGEDIAVRSVVGRFGWGKNFALTKSPLLSLDAGVGFGVGKEEVFPLLRISPRIRLSKRLSWRIDAGYEYRQKAQLAYHTQDSFAYRAPKWRIGSALEVRL